MVMFLDNISLYDDFIQTLDDLMIVSEGYNINTAKLINSDNMKKAVQYQYIAGKYGERGEYDKAIKYMKEAIKKADSVRKIVASMPEPTSDYEKLKSNLTPVFSTLPLEAGRIKTPYISTFTDMEDIEGIMIAFPSVFIKILGETILNKTLVVIAMLKYILRPLLLKYFGADLIGQIIEDENTLSTFSGVKRNVLFRINAFIFDCAVAIRVYKKIKNGEVKAVYDS